MNDIYRDVMFTAANNCGVSLEKAITRVRHPEAVTARYVAWYILNTHYGWSHSTIARHAIVFDRTTIRHGINRIADMPATSSVGEIVARTLAGVHYL